VALLRFGGAARAAAVVVVAAEAVAAEAVVVVAAAVAAVAAAAAAAAAEAASRDGQARGAVPVLPQSTSSRRDDACVFCSTSVPRNSRDSRVLRAT